MRSQVRSPPMFYRGSIDADLGWGSGRRGRMAPGGILQYGTLCTPSNIWYTRICIFHARAGDLAPERPYGTTTNLKAWRALATCNFALRHEEQVSV